MLNLNYFEIKNLYGRINLKLNFNEDINLIYGDNGCGKTTVLNIISYILKGDFIPLSKYSFDKLKLVFNLNSSVEIKTDKNRDEFVVSYDIGNVTNSFRIPIIIQNHFDDYEIYRTRNIAIHDSLNKDLVNFKKILSKKLNLLVIPLNRINFSDLGDLEKEKLYMNIKKQSIRHSNSFDSDLSDLIFNGVTDSLISISKKLRTLYLDEVLRFKSREDKLNQKEVFRILIGDTSKLRLISDKDESNSEVSSKDDSDSTVHDLVDEQIKYFQNFINKTDKKELSQNLDNLLKEESFMVKKFDDLFFNVEQYIEDLRNHIKLKESDADILFLVLNGISLKQTIEKYKEIVKIFEKSKDKLKKKEKKYSLLVEIINTFFSNKSIRIDEGDIKIFDSKNEKKKIKLSQLSSGEKQILLFFISCIYHMFEKKSGVLIIDEPEISLNISWQRLFVKSINKINPKIQLIFATHSPFIVHDFDEKLIELEELK